jgi:iron-sulfur cluster repair protein YtfE (RIC family)
MPEKPSGPRSSPRTTHRPSEVRQLVLRDHDHLRDLLAAIDGIVARPMANLSQLSERLGELDRAMREHLEREEALLVPALRATDRWGPARLQALKTAHSAHTLAVSELARDAARPGAEAQSIAMRVRVLMIDLRCDMEEEECSLLLPGILQDDMISLDQSDG